MFAYLIELFNPSTIKGSVLCGIVSAVVITGFTYILKKLLKKVKGDDFFMEDNVKKDEIGLEKSDNTNLKRNKQVKNKDVNNFDEIKIKGNISGTVNIGSGSVKIYNKK